ncbi:hypothetical protein IFM89_033858 [Coptis chinensis]|uniref:Uncharacterized protein n=1 Tax=Coptis chinensis TaxID=261450 RepID=A0A835LT92_9MAGN|nr:hypothetical protein IFM89_024961 [Coptis chinensis]KAF9607313.1 hypothetical protein IFM89_033858 [Coptis chinensis]
MDVGHWALVELSYLGLVISEPVRFGPCPLQLGPVDLGLLLFNAIYVIVSDNCSDAPMNYVGNEHISVMNCPTVANELVHVLNQPVEKNGEAENISCMYKLM